MNEFKTIKISQEVWNAIAARGKFGETEEVVLRRVLDIKSPSPANSVNVWKRQALDALRAKCTGNELIFQFDSGPQKKVVLPQPEDKTAIRKIRDEAVSWATQHGATEGQIKFVQKEFTSRGYHVNKGAHLEFLE
jgi:hypothetical protein